MFPWRTRCPLSRCRKGLPAWADPTARGASLSVKHRRHMPESIWGGHLPSSSLELWSHRLSSCLCRLSFTHALSLNLYCGASEWEWEECLRGYDLQLLFLKSVTQWQDSMICHPRAARVLPLRTSSSYFGQMLDQFISTCFVFIGDLTGVCKPGGVHCVEEQQFNRERVPTAPSEGARLQPGTTIQNTYIR